MKLVNFFASAALGLATALGSVGAQAAIVTYTGADNNVSSLAQMTNSAAAAAAFESAVPGASVITFEGPLPGGVSISGGSITNFSGCGSLCGINTTPGGQNFLSLRGGSSTFTFSTPIHAFGAYITGLQTDIVPQETLTFSDGSAQVINVPSSINGGGAFVGFTDFGANITSVTYNATGDIVALDDVQFSGGTAGVPEPAIWAMMLVGFGGLGAVLRAHRRADRDLAALSV
jgi:hypothetical protein